MPHPFGDLGPNPFSDLRLAGEVDGPDWAKVFELAVLHGEKLCSVQLPPRAIIIPDWFNEGDCGFILCTARVG